MGLRANGRDARWAWLLAFATASAVGANPAIAQDAPAAAPAHTERAAAPPAEDADDDVLEFSLGTIFNYGNTRSFQLAGGVHFALQRDVHLVGFDLGGNVGTASVRDANTGEFVEWTEAARNVLGRLRYDLFLTPDDALYAAVVGRHDIFSGLDFRLQAQPGYMRNFFREGENDVHRFWGEVGFDYTFDDRFPNPLFDLSMLPCNRPGFPIDPAVGDCPTLADVEHQYSARLFLGYDNHLNENWSFLTGLEALFDFVNGENIRLTSITEARVRIEGNFQASLRVTVLFDNVPVPGSDKVDTNTVLSLIYTMF